MSNKKAHGLFIYEKYIHTCTRMYDSTPCRIDSDSRKCSSFDATNSYKLFTNFFTEKVYINTSAK